MLFQSGCRTIKGGQKKKSDSSVGKNTSQAEKKEIPSPSAENLNLEKTESQTVEPKQEKERSEESKSSSIAVEPSKSRSTQIMSVPGIGNLTELRKQVKGELEAKKLERNALTDEILLTHWNDYIDTLDSNGVKAALKSAKASLKIEDSNYIIHVLVGSQISKATVLQEQGLLQYIREKTLDDDLRLQVEIDEALAPEESTVKPLSKDEIFSQMKEQNPWLGKMVEKLNLKFKQ